MGQHQALEDTTSNPTSLPSQEQLLGTQTEIPMQDMMVQGAEHQSSHQLFGFPCASHRVGPSAHSTAISDSVFLSFSTCLIQGLSPYLTYHQVDGLHKYI